MLDLIAYADVQESDLVAPPVARAETIPSAWYTEERFLRLDREALFRRTWQGVGHVDRVREPGQHFIEEIAGDPVIVVRGQDGELRAFYNVCRHRGGPLAMEDGCAKALRCKYHGWTYLLDGSLRGVPRMDRTELFDRKDYGLVPLHVATWQGLVFVHLGDDPEPLETQMAGIAERIAPERLDGKRWARRVDYEVACNWKVYVDNYLEGYHVPYVHPELVKLYDYTQYVTEVFPHYSLQFSPLSGDASLYAADGGGSAWYYCLFPNFMLNILPGRLQTNFVQPLGPDRCRVTFQYYYDDVDSAGARAFIDEDHDYSDRVQAEDAEICAHVQRGLASHAYDRGRFSVAFEEGVYHFQSLLRDAYRRGLGR